MPTPHVVPQAKYEVAEVRDVWTNDARNDGRNCYRGVSRTAVTGSQERKRQRHTLGQGYLLLHELASMDLGAQRGGNG